MAKKITLELLDKKLDARFSKIDDRFSKLEHMMEKGFGALADDISKLATKDQLFALHTQVSGIDSNIRSMKEDKLLSRVIDLEEEVFGKARH